MNSILRRIIATGVASLIMSIPAWASDYRDAPTAALYGAIDLEALYMFRDPPCNTSSCSSPNLVVALTVDGDADPLFGPTYHFQPNALYRINFTTRVDAQPTAHIDVTFGPFASGPNCPSSDPCQTFKAVFPGNVVVNGLTTQGTWAATHNSPAITTVGNIQAFAGPREDPVFFDLVGFERTIQSFNNKFTGVDAFRGENADAIVLEFPISMVFPAGVCQATLVPLFSTPCGAWAVTYFGTTEDELVQIDRLANPLVTAALIPFAQKDAFNAAQPKNDARNFAHVIFGQILALDTGFGTCPPSATNVATCNPNTPLLASLLVPDTLKFAINQPDGYPNGRQPSDRGYDILLSLILQLPGFTDGTSAKQFCSQFPYLGPPLQLDATAPFNIIPQTCP